MISDSKAEARAMTIPVKPICRGEQPCEARDGLTPAPESEICKTNPIGRRAEIPQHSTILSFDHSSPMPIVQTKPNLGTLGYLGNKTRDAEQMRQTNPICARAIWRISVVRTRSCDQWDARAASGKQSQFGRSCRFEVCRGRPLCLPCSRATTGGCPYRVMLDAI
jgi:hypothetical protein